MQKELQEVEFLLKIRDQSAGHPGHAHILQLKDSFLHNGPHGQHLCIVTEPLFQNMRLFSMRFPRRIMPLRLVRSLARQIVFGVQYLHDECNIIHTDLKPDNLLMVAPDGQQFFNDHYTEIHNTPEVYATTDPAGNSITRVCSDPLYFPLPGSIAQDDDIWLKLQVKITDLGVGMHNNTRSGYGQLTSSLSMLGR